MPYASLESVIEQSKDRIPDFARNHGRVSAGDILRLTGVSRNTPKAAVEFESTRRPRLPHAPQRRPHDLVYLTVDDKTRVFCCPWRSDPPSAPPTGTLRARYFLLPNNVLSPAPKVFGGTSYRRECSLSLSGHLEFCRVQAAVPANAGVTICDAGWDRC